MNILHSKIKNNIFDDKSLDLIIDEEEIEDYQIKEDEIQPWEADEKTFRKMKDSIKYNMKREKNNGAD